MASGTPQPALHRRPSISQTFRRLARRLSITSLSHSRTLRSPPASPPLSAVSTSRPPSRLALSRLRRPSNALSPSTSTVAPPIPEAAPSSWPPPATLLRKGKHTDYDVSPLLRCTRVAELWDESEKADTFVYLCAKEDAAKRSPSFKVDGSVLKRRSTFFEAALAERWQSSSAGPKELYFPSWDAKATPLEQLRDRIALRNFFSFILSGGRSSGDGYGFLVLSPPYEGLLLLDFTRRVEMYHLPPPSTSSLSSFIVAHGLDDPRASPLRTLDVLLASTHSTPPLSQQIRRESFLHAAGQYRSLVRLPEFASLVPGQMKLQLQRNHHAIAVRVQRSQSLLKTLAFPTIPGAATTPGHASSSTTRTLSPPLGWEPAFKELRAVLIAHYSKLFRTRHWPPRNFSRGLALQIIRDVQMLQSLLYDPGDSSASSSSLSTSHAHTDPFRPLLSTITGSSRYPRVPPTTNLTAHTLHHRLSADEAAVMVLDCWSASSAPASSNHSLVERIRALEIRAATGKTRGEFVEAREGRWVLLSVVRRAVEEVVGRGEWDGVKWGWGVEWWLCADWEDDVEEVPEEEEMERDEDGRVREGKREGSQEEGAMGKELSALPAPMQMVRSSSEATGTSGVSTAGGNSAAGGQRRRPSLFGG